MSDELPEGWGRTTVGAIASITSGKFLRRDEYVGERSDRHRFPVAGAGGPIGWSSTANTTGPLMTLGRVGACGAFSSYPTDAWVTDNALVVRPHVEPMRDFLALFLQTVPWQRLQTGTSQPLITQTLVRGIEMPLPPLPEQRRISAKVGALLARVNLARDRLEKVPGLLKRFRQSVLAAACSGRLTEDGRTNLGAGDSTWVDVPLGEIADVIDPNPSHRYPSYERGTVPILATEQMRGLSGWDVSNSKLANAEFHSERVASHGFRPDDIIFARKGRLGLARRPPSLAKYVFSHTLFIVRQKAKSNSDYLLWFLRQDRCVAWLLGAMNSNTGVPTLGKGYMEQLPVRLPPPDAQAVIVKRIEALFARADIFEEALERARVAVGHAPQSILQKALAGELVSQDPHDEPATVPLEPTQAKEENLRSPKGAPRGKGRRSTVNATAAGHRDLVEVVAMSPEGVSPDELFGRAGYRVEEPEDVARFYQALRVAIREVSLQEVRTPAGDPRILARP